jgi:hypothetical protein
MLQTFDLKGMGFAEMQAEELRTVDGGGTGEIPTIDILGNKTPNKWHGKH